MKDDTVSSRRRVLMLTPVFGAALMFGLAKEDEHSMRHIVMLVQTNGPSIEVDRTAATRLEARGYRIRLVDHWSRPQDIGMPVLVIVSSTRGKSRRDERLSPAGRHELRQAGESGYLRVRERRYDGLRSSSARAPRDVFSRQRELR